MAGQPHTIVYLARHGTTNLNAVDAFRGPIDAPLDAQGRRDAHQLAFYFEGIDLCGIFHSDKKRTRETAGILKGTRDIPLHANPNLAAWNVGDLGGQPKNDENLATVKWHVENPDVALPGGESLNEFKARVRPLISDAVDIAQNHGIPVLLVVHSSVIHEVGSMLANDHEYTLVEPGGVAAIFIRNGQYDCQPIFKGKPEDVHDRVEMVT